MPAAEHANVQRAARRATAGRNASAGRPVVLVLLAALLPCCGGERGPDPAASAPAAADAAPGAAADAAPTLPGAPPVVVEVLALDVIEAFHRREPRVSIVAQHADPALALLSGPGNFEKDTRLASDADHTVVRAAAGSVFDVRVGPLGPGAHLLARTLVYTELAHDPERADPAPVTFRVLVDGVEQAALRSDYILQPGPSEHPYDRLMRTLDVPLPQAAEREVTLRFETTRLGAPEPAPGTSIPEVVWWDLAVLRALPVARAAADAAHPNLLFLLVDTLAARRTSLHGAARDTTPQLRALAARGLRFDRALSPSSWTLPATASLLTGLPPNEHGVLGDRRSYLMDGLRTWPEVLREQGLEGAAFVANTLVSRANNFHQGFGEHWVQANDETAAQLNARLLAWLDGQPQGARWFGYVHYMDPHAPYDAPGAARDRYAEAGPAPQALSRLHPEQVQRGELPPPGAEVRAHLTALYDAEIAYFDACLGQLLAALEQRGLLQHTVVLLTADHGEELFDHGRWGHGYTLHDELLHVPLVAAGPGIRPGVRADPVSTSSAVSLLLSAMRAPQLPGALPMPAPPAPGVPAPDVFSAVRTSLFGPQRNLVSVQRGSAKLICEMEELAAGEGDAGRTGGAGGAEGGEGAEGALGEAGATAVRPVCYDLAADPGEQHPLPACDAELLAAAQAWYRATAARRLPEPQPQNPHLLEELQAIGYLGDEPRDGR